MMLQDKKISPLKTPSVDYRWRFGDLGAAELTAKLQQHVLTDNAQHWQIVWLDNDGQPLIGLLPKVSWSIYSYQDTSAVLALNTAEEALYDVVTYCRDEHQTTYDKISYTDWQQRLIDYSQQQNHQYPNTKTRAKHSSDTPSYYQGLIGFIGYDIAANQLSPTTDINQAAQPCAVLGHYDIYLSLDGNQGWALHVIADTEQSANLKSTGHNTSDKQRLAVNMVVNALDQLDQQLSNPFYQNRWPNLAPLTLRADWKKADYARAFYHVQDYLVQGDCYQINLTQVWQGVLDNKDNNQTTLLADYLPLLQRRTHAPFAGYLGVNNLSNGQKNDGSKSLDFELLSCSPELFFTFTKADNQHHIRTKPIKGTQPRGMNAAQDSALKQQLMDSNKDRAENVMIVDLLRNDLGKYAQIGSVKVPKLFAIESFSNVHHMVSTITATLKPNTHPIKVLFGSLPAGSITGTPKVRAVEIIHELESQPRGAYCGTMGYMNFDGTGQWNVLIRTLQATALNTHKKQVNLWAGGGITIASDVDAEYQECLDKVGNLLDILAQPIIPINK